MMDGDWTGRQLRHCGGLQRLVLRMLPVRVAVSIPHTGETPWAPCFFPFESIYGLRSEIRER
jgi:hypothetical protein